MEGPPVRLSAADRGSLRRHDALGRGRPMAAVRGRGSHPQPTACGARAGARVPAARALRSAGRGPGRPAAAPRLRRSHAHDSRRLRRSLARLAGLAPGERLAGAGLRRRRLGWWHGQSRRRGGRPRGAGRCRRPGRGHRHGLLLLLDPRALLGGATGCRLQSLEWRRTAADRGQFRALTGDDSRSGHARPSRRLARRRSRRGPGCGRPGQTPARE